MVEQITKYCKRCKGKFMYGDMSKSLSGQMSRKYCDDCIPLQYKLHIKTECDKKRALRVIQ